jgi:putative transposase
MPSPWHSATASPSDPDARNYPQLCNKKDNSCLSSHRRLDTLVRKDATVRLFGGAYETDPALAGRKAECVFDPFDLSVLEIRWNGSPYGLAVPRKIGRHSHPKAKPEEPGTPPPATGIDYLGIIAAEHAEAARRHRIRYDALDSDSEREDGQ